MDLFADYIANGTGKWHKRSLTDRSMMYQGLREDETNAVLATYGDALLKFAYCEILLDTVEELSMEKAKYESDVSLVRIAEHYQLLEHLNFRQDDPQIPKDYQTRKMEREYGIKKKQRIRQFNRKRKYLATAVEAILGAMYKDGYTFSQIVQVVRGWKQILEAQPDFDGGTERR